MTDDEIRSKRVLSDFEATEAIKRAGKMEEIPKLNDDFSENKPEPVPTAIPLPSPNGRVFGFSQPN